MLETESGIRSELNGNNGSYRVSKISDLEDQQRVTYTPYTPESHYSGPNNAHTTNTQFSIHDYLFGQVQRNFLDEEEVEDKWETFFRKCDFSSIIQLYDLISEHVLVIQRYFDFKVLLGSIHNPCYESN